MGLNFPNAPTVGQLYPQPAVAGVPVFRWNGSAWDTQGPAMDGSVHWDAPQTLTDPQRAQARANVFAAPFDVMAFSGMQINGSGEISLERASNSFVPAVASTVYVQDGWKFYFTSAPLVMGCFPANGPGPPLAGFSNCISIDCSTGKATLAAGDRIILDNMIEGYRVARLGWGAANAQPVSIGFWVTATIPGTMAVTITNSAANRAYVSNVVINSANVWEYKTLTVPGDVTGTWDRINGAGMIIRFGFGSGSIYQVPAGAWSSTYGEATTATTNFFATNNNAASITGLIVVPGSELPSASRSPFIMRRFDQELLDCQRYYQKSYAYTQIPGTNIGGSIQTGLGVQTANGTSNPWLGSSFLLPVRMRTTPTMTVYDLAGAPGKISGRVSNAWVSGQTPSAGPINECSLSVTAGNVANIDAIAYHFVADARL